MEDKSEAIRTLSTVCPHYFREDPALFFEQLESECEIRGVSSQKVKFHLVVSSLPHETMLEVRNYIPVTKEKTNTKLRDELIKRPSTSL